MKISVLGLGYIGLPTALLFAQSGFEVSGYDVDSKKITTLRKGMIPFVENGLATLFNKVQKQKTFSVSATLKSSDIYIIAVPTPQNKGRADLRYVVSALGAVKEVFKKNQMIIIESTIGPRDCIDTLLPTIQNWNIPFKFVHCPERAIPGSTLHEMVHNDRIIGAEHNSHALAAKKLYKSFVKGQLFTTTTTIAASAKVMENTYRAVNIALANEFSQLAETVGFNVWEAIKLANKHPRVNIHVPGPGVGGHCIPIDPWFFVSTARAPFINEALVLNEQMPARICKKIEKIIKQRKLHKPTIGILGYAYKKNVDDSRETPAEKIIKTLGKKYTVLVNDPYVKQPEFIPLAKLLKTVEMIVLLTDHDEYKNIQFNKYQQIQCVYDSRNVFSDKNFLRSNAQHYLLGTS